MMMIMAMAMVMTMRLTAFQPTVAGFGPRHSWHRSCEAMPAAICGGGPTFSVAADRVRASTPRARAWNAKGSLGGGAASFYERRE